MAQSISTRPVRADHISRWDHTADVVVVGYSIAGVTAALSADENGAKVLALERGASSAGANGVMLYLGGGTPMQEAAGFKDTPENMEAFLRIALGPGVDEDKLHEYCSRSVEHYHWLVSKGLKFVTEADPTDYHLSIPDSDGFLNLGGQEYAGHGLAWSGGENAYPFDDVVLPAARGHIPRSFADNDPGEIWTGIVLKQLLAHAVTRPIDVRYKTAVDRLVINETGAVVGVQYSSEGSTINVKARKGVVITTGGFIFNDDMLQQYSPRLTGLPKVGHRGQDGLGIRIAQQAGADVAHMDAKDITLIMIPPMSYSTGMLVNATGQRFMNEDTYYGRLGDKAWNTHGGEVFLIIDKELYQESGSIPPMVVSESIEELEQKAGFPQGALRMTLDYYNKHARNGEDPLLHKGARWLRPLNPPYLLLDLRNGARGGNPTPGLDFSIGGSTMGGLRTNKYGQVLRPDGSALAGLYAAGRASECLAVEGYCSGVSLSDCTFFGRAAGSAAAQSNTRCSAAFTVTER